MCGNNNNNNTARRGLTYDGCNLFKQRLVLSTLNCKRVKIQNVRSKEDNPGLRDFVASYIRLLDKLGLLYGGVHPLKAVLKGVTNMDSSVRPCSFPTLKIYLFLHRSTSSTPCKKCQRRALNYNMKRHFVDSSCSAVGLLWADPGGRDLFLSAEQLSTPLGQGDPVLPEDLRRNWAKLLLEEIYKVGCIDSTNQSLALMYMTLGQENLCNALHGHLSLHTRTFITIFFFSQSAWQNVRSKDLSCSMNSYNGNC
uniref:RNA 3'-terminal phosphate cyclase domain-containing protein n=1 Tax=Hucho hucho TaxID=62062 RepID=A0A4W5QDG8_9TELE